MLSRNRIMERLDLMHASVARMQRFVGMSYDDFVLESMSDLTRFVAQVDDYLRGIERS